MEIFRLLTRPVLFIVILCVNQSYGQSLEIPRASPKAMISQMIGVCKVEVHYGRPSANGRKILGGLIPYNKVWRAGANEATVIAFNYEVSIDGRKIPEGKYALFMIPEKDKWTVIFNSEWKQWGAYHYNKNKDVLRVEVMPENVAFVEMCTYDFIDVSKTNGVLNLSWENFSVSINITTDTHIQTESEINKAIGISRKEWYTFSAAAQYYFYELKDAIRSLEYVNQAIALDAPNPSPWMLKSQILASQGKYQKAIELAEDAIMVSKRHNFPFEISENKENIEKWKKLYRGQYLNSYL